ncbi:MAG: transport protein TqsA [Propionibacteriaceae bacterium]|nr:transport protein TqsA [Propionibacteriaceae bacterium]
MPATSTKLRYPAAETTPPPPLFGVLVLAGLVIVGVGLKSVSSIVGPVFLVLTLVITVNPLRVWLVRHRCPRTLASIAALTTVYALLIVVLGSVVWSLTRLVNTLTDFSAAFTKLYTGGLAQLAKFGVSTSMLQDALSSINLSSFAGVAQTLLNGVTSGLSLLVLMLAMVFFLVFDAVGIEDRIALIRRERPQVADALIEFSHSVRLYWVVTTVFGAIVAILDVIALAIIGVPLAFTWGVLAFVTNFIPNIGFILGLVPPALIALLSGGVGPAIAVIVVYTLINVIIQTFIQPRFTGDAVGITGTVAFLSLIFWAYLLGPLGALLAVPATLLVKSLLVDNSAAGRWLGALINAAPKIPKPVPRIRRPAQVE